MNEVTDRKTDLLIAQEEENRQKRKEHLKTITTA